MKSKDGRQYCDFCRRWLDGDSYWVDVPKNLYFCDPSCAGHAKSYSAECVSVPKAPKPESVPTQQPLEVPDIYLAELVGVIRRALQADGMTKRLWAILDNWCDEQESYLEEAYPEAHEQATARDSVTVDWLNSRGPVFPGLNTFIRTGYQNASVQVDGVDIPELPSVSPEFGAYRKASDELMERMPNWFVPELRHISPEDYEKLKGAGLVTYSMRDSGVKYTSSDGQRFVVAGNDSTCTCQAFQGDNQQCTLHGEGTAWYDLHGGE